MAASLGQIRTGTRKDGAAAMTDVSSVGEEVLRGKMSVGGPVGAIYDGVNSATMNQQNNPKGAPADPKSAAAGGIFDPARRGGGSGAKV